MRDLPKCVHRKHGAFYLVRGGKWTRLCSDRDEVDICLAAAAAVPIGNEAIHRYALRALARARANAKGRRRIEFSLTKDQVTRLLNECGWRCAVTKTPFSLDVIGPKKQRPFAPSIDRIDSNGPYSLGNCRIVCVAANFAMNTWGAGVLMELARNAARTESIRQRWTDRHCA